MKNINLTDEQAGSLLLLLRAVGGDIDDTPRKYTDEVSAELDRMWPHIAQNIQENLSEANNATQGAVYFRHTAMETLRNIVAPKTIVVNGVTYVRT